MRKANIPIFIDYTVQWHTAQFEEIDLLPVHPGNFMIGVRQANEWNVFVRPILLKGCRRIGTDRNNLYIAVNKLLIIVTQARQLRAAVRSHESAQEGKQNNLASAKTRKADKIAVYIRKFKVGGEFSGGDQFVH